MMPGVVGAMQNPDDHGPIVTSQTESLIDPGWRLADFDFDLPPAAIALRPARPRDSARLLAVGTPEPDRSIRDLPGLLRRGDILVFNDTRVIAARLTGRRDTYSIDVTLHQILPGGSGLIWSAFARPGRRLRVGDCILFADDMEAVLLEKRDNGEIILQFSDTGTAFSTWLEQHGAIPLPPYISRRRAPDEQDRDDYQTIFAHKPGAVAAPTAGLHFTPGLLTAIENAGIHTARITLNVGAGSFQPVKADRLKDHRMHGEQGCIDHQTAEAINAARSAGGQVVAVGTTCLRLLETAADRDGWLSPWQGETRLFITPGYSFRCVDRLLTNFHLPRSTLFILVCAFAGLEVMKDVYSHACSAGYRFYSYGDACLLSRLADNTFGR